jgi:hypothetical protein
MFDLDTFIGDCRAALAADPSHGSVREVVARAVSDASAVIRRAQTGDRSEALPFQRSHHPQCDLGAAHDDHASQSPDVGRDRYLHRS